MSCEPDLIYDVGMHNGDDTAYYLHKGYRVVAIEANPELIAPAERRFAAAISAGRLQIVNVAVAAQHGELDLYVSSSFDMLGSLSAENAAKLGGSVHAIKVSCRPLGEILDEYSVPYYMKVDIEGADRLCIDALRPPALPAFVSIEMDHAAGNADIARLATLGYQRFQCIRQNDLASVTPTNLSSQLRLRRLRAGGGVMALGVRVIRRVLRSTHPARDGAWRFPPGSSGPFGRDLKGQWLDVQQILAVWQALHDVDAELATGGVGEWFDIHAALDGSRGANGG